MSHSDLCGRCRHQRRAHIDTVAGLLCPTMRYVPPAPRDPNTGSATEGPRCVECGKPPRRLDNDGCGCALPDSVEQALAAYDDADHGYKDCGERARAALRSAVRAALDSERNRREHAEMSLVTERKWHIEALDVSGKRQLLLANAYAERDALRAALSEREGPCFRCGESGHPGQMECADKPGAKVGTLFPCPYCQPGMAVDWMASVAWDRPTPRAEAPCDDRSGFCLSHRKPTGECDREEQITLLLQHAARADRAEAALSERDAALRAMLDLFSAVYGECDGTEPECHGCRAKALTDRARAVLSETRAKECK